MGLYKSIFFYYYTSFFLAGQGSLLTCMLLVVRMEINKGKPNS